MRDLKSEILSATDGGLDIFKNLCPNIPDNLNKKFRVRPPDDDKDESASLRNKLGVYYLTDFGDDGIERNAIDYYMKQHNVDFPTAIKRLAEDLSLMKSSTRNSIQKANKLHVGDKDLVLKKFSNDELEYFGDRITSQLLKQYDIHSLESYGKLKSKKRYFLFLYGPFSSGESKWCKVNRPFEKKDRFFQVGPRLRDFIFGFKQLPFYCDTIIITSGEKDVVSLAAKGYHAVAFNSETVRITDEQISLLKSKCKTLYVLYDIDESGKKNANKIINKYPFILKIVLPEELKNHKDFRGNSSKDVSEYFRYYSRKQFDELIDLAKSSANIKVNVDNLVYVDKKERLNVSLLSLLESLNAIYVYKYRIGDKEQFVRVEDAVIYKISPNELKDLVVNEMKLQGKRSELEKLMRGTNYYFNPYTLSNLPLKRELPEFKGEFKKEYFFFLGKIWSINKEQVTELDYKDFHSYIWDCQLIDWYPVLEPDYFKISKNSKGTYHLDYQKGYCDFLDFIYNTSNVYWEKEETEIIEDEKNEISLHFLNKITSLGYLLHTAREGSQRKGVIATDFVERNKHEEQGGTGKSVYGDALIQMLPTYYRGARQKNLLDDRHLLGGVEYRTKLVFFDDAGKSFDFGLLYTWITGRIDINKKFKDVVVMDQEHSVKFFITTNFSMLSKGKAHDRRAHFVIFSDYYNLNHQPINDFGQDFFSKTWSYQQRNRFYNLMAQCVKAYFQFGLVEAPKQNLKRNQIRASINEAFLEWAEENEDLFVGQNIYRPDFDKPFIASLSEYERRNMSTRIIKESLKQYCELKGLLFNPSKKGKDIKRNSKEYYEIQLAEGGTNGKR
ncbi:toprim domain-containing protein [Carboxylicivirga marina]|uniref:Toprim domain-containing protein n=1 Tax=Carboxylicivirga marina TaxID=2800988 RepID=A0ABS1HM15_9BACT|nr:toprim domain-containing protein [Carboxylicivirga marina]MBK3518721.1 toprim domain-containing protein [Carboxylicivirga marina]